MMPALDRDAFGWDAPARTFLILATLVSGSALACSSGGRSAGVAEVPTLMVDANSAPVAVLGALPGLGPVLAGRIVEGRPFRSLDDFDRRVRGIGPARVAALRPFLRFDPPAGPTP